MVVKFLNAISGSGQRKKMDRNLDEQETGKKASEPKQIPAKSPAAKKIEPKKAMAAGKKGAEKDPRGKFPR